MNFRALEPEDLTLLYDLENDPDMWDVCTPGGPYSHFALLRYVEQQGQDLLTAGQLRLVAENDEGRMLGTLDLTNYSPTDRSAEVGVAVLRAERKRGVATEMLRWLDDHARLRLNLRMLYAHVSLRHNPASMQLFLSRGYEQVAVLPAWHFRMGEYEDLALMQKLLK